MTTRRDSRRTAAGAGVAKSIEVVQAGGDTLDAVLEGVNIVERDPNDTSAGYGRLPKLDDQCRPNFGVNYYLVNKRGEYAGASIFAGTRSAVCVHGETRLEDSAYLFERY